VRFASPLCRLQTKLKSGQFDIISLVEKNFPGATVPAWLAQLYCTQHFQYIKYTQIQGLAAQSCRLCHSTL
jgi:hypothetical protein